MKQRSIFFSIIITAIVMISALSIVTPPLQHDENSLVISELRTSGTMSRHAPITITSDADYPGLASSGDGSLGNPWIIQNFLIECNGSGTGILVQNANDHAIFRNIAVNESGSGPTDANIAVQNSNNIIFSNVTCEAAGMINVALAISENITFNNSTIVDAAYTLLYISGTENLNFTNVVFNDSASLVIQYQVMFDSTYGSTNVTLFDSCVFQSADNGIIRAITGSHYGLIVQNSTFFADKISISILDDDTVVQSCNFTSFTNGTATFIYVDAQRAIIDNCTFNEPLQAITLQGGSDEAVISNCTFLSPSGEMDTGIYVNGPDDVRVVSSYFSGAMNDTSDPTGGSSGISIVNPSANTSCSDNIFTNSHICIHEFGNGTVINNNFFDACNYAITIDESVNLICNNNIFNDQANASFYFFIGTSGYGVEGNHLIFNNTINVETLIDANTVTSLDWVGNVTFAFNAFNYSSLYNAVIPENLTFTHNAYIDYFTQAPYAITNTTSMVYLDTMFVLDSLYTDLVPIYRAAYVNRSENVNLRVFSNVNGQGVLFENLKVQLDGVQVSSPALVVEHVLFRITIRDFKNRLLHDAVYNVNATGMNLNIGVDIAVQIFFNFYSTIDYFGLDFTIVRLYIDGVRITRFDPIMELKTINVTVKDYASTTLYSQVKNLSQTGIYLDIGLPIALISFRNDYDHGVILYLIKKGTSISYSLPRESSISLRLATGNYRYIVCYLNGTEIIDENVDFDALEPESFVVSFGWASVAPSDTINNYTTNPLDYFVMMFIFGGTIGAMLFVSVLFKKGTSMKIASLSRKRDRRNKSNDSKFEVIDFG